MKLGADPKRLAVLGGLVLIGGYVLWKNVFSDSSPSPVVRRPQAQDAAASSVVRSTPADTERVLNRRTAQRATGDWHPPLKDSAHVIDPLKVDPTLRLDLLAKVQQVDVDASAQRNIFSWGETPKPPDNSPLPSVGKIAMGGKPKSITPAGPPPPPPAVVPPPPPPITLKYYGFSTPKATGHKRAFFLDGDDIILASEGDLIKRRYKLVKIGVNSVTVEDEQYHNNQQTLPLIEDLAG